MAAKKTVLKNTDGEAVIKIVNIGANDVVTIALADLLTASQVTPVGATRKVSIKEIDYSLAGACTIYRNAILAGNEVGSLHTAQVASPMQFLAPDIEMSDKDIVIDMPVGQLFIRLSKYEGYASTIEASKFGSYDNPAVAGA